MITPLIRLEEISKRLQEIFSVGIPDRNYFVRDIAARTIFVFIYTDAIEGSEVWLAPKHILRMSDAQSDLTSVVDRMDYAKNCMKPGYKPIDNSWYQENTRESIRDETINGLVNIGIVNIKEGIPTTSSKGRYQLKKSFAELFRSKVKPSDISLWQNQYLSESYLAKIKIMERASSNEEVIVFLPNGISRKMEAGPSSFLTKAVIEVFAKKHLLSPAVVWISESGNKVIADDEELMKSIKLPIDQKKLLPDIVLADLGRKELLLVFVEVVATDGPFTQKRKEDILSMSLGAGYKTEQILFMSAFKDRNDQALKRRFSALALDSLVWCASEPQTLIWIAADQEKPFVI